MTQSGIFLRKGEELGMFEMGSSIVLMYECPDEMEITRKEGDTVKMGEQLSAMQTK